MTTNKPEIKAWIISAYIPYSGFQRHVCMSEDDARHSRATFEWLKGEVEEVPLIRLSDYEALQAECDALLDKTSMSLGVGDGTGNLFVYGDYDSIKRVQALIFECEKLRRSVTHLEKLLSAAAAGYATKMAPMSVKLLNATDAAMQDSKE